MAQKAKTKKVILKTKTSSKKSSVKKVISKKKAARKVLKKKIVKKKSVKKKFPKKKKPEKSILKKSRHNPIISPEKENAWESSQTFNPGAVMINDEVHILYRAIGADWVSRFGYAVSKDGFKIHKKETFPAYEHSTIPSEHMYYSISSGGSWSGAEDPRIVRVEDEDILYVTFTSCKEGLGMGLTTIKVEDFINNRWKWTKHVLLSPPGEVHKNWVIFPEKINGKYAILHSISPEISVEYLDSLTNLKKPIKSIYHPGKPSKRWDSFLRGPGPPPLKTKYGWLLLYHAMSHKDMGKYKLGAMLLDLKDPTRIKYRSTVPILVPDERYEMEGDKSGVVYASGAVIKDERLLIYYGGADSFVCVAYLDLKELLDSIRGKKKKKVKLKILKKR